MNITGFLRGYMAKASDADKFIKIVANAIGREFEDEVQIIDNSKNDYKIIFKGYEICINANQIEQLKSKSPYAVDRFLLTEFRKHGFKFDEYRSQYIMYCFNHF